MICKKCGAELPTNEKLVFCCGLVYVRKNGLLSQKPKQQKSLWYELHQYAPEHADNWDPHRAELFFADWESKIPNCCSQNWKKYRANLPTPPFYSPHQFFSWGVDAHNYVSTHHANPPHPEITLDQAYAEWWSIAPQSSELLILTIATGTQCRKLLEITGPTIEVYAKKCNADYLALTNHTKTWWGLEKFRVYGFAKQYKRTLFVDADVVIKDSAPNIFDEVPRGRVGIHDDYDHLPSTYWMRPEKRDVFSTQGIDGIIQETCLNSGIVLTDQQHADVWKPPLEPFPTTHCAEQFWVEYNILSRDYPVYRLDWRWNTQWYWKDFKERTEDCYFIHLANDTQKEQDAKQYAKQFCTVDLCNTPNR